MTPKEKAKEMVNKFYYYVESISESQQQENAKQCALIAVDEILESCYLEKEWFFEEVKEEINKL
jgi:hypothetical protein